jgi:hypothetical protein
MSACCVQDALRVLNTMTLVQLYLLHTPRPTSTFDFLLLAPFPPFLFAFFLQRAVSSLRHNCVQLASTIIYNPTPSPSSDRKRSVLVVVRRPTWLREGRRNQGLREGMNRWHDTIHTTT